MISELEIITLPQKNSLTVVTEFLDPDSV